MDNKYRKILTRAYKIISPDFDPTQWTDIEFQTCFVADVNYLLNQMARVTKQIEERNVKIDTAPILSPNSEYVFTNTNSITAEYKTSPELEEIRKIARGDYQL